MPSRIFESADKLEDDTITPFWAFRAVSAADSVLRAIHRSAHWFSFLTQQLTSTKVPLGLPERHSDPPEWLTCFGPKCLSSQSLLLSICGGIGFGVAPRYLLRLIAKQLMQFFIMLFQLTLPKSVFFLQYQFHTLQVNGSPKLGIRLPRL